MHFRKPVFENEPKDIAFRIEGNNSVSNNGFWIDLNNNGTKDEGEELQLGEHQLTVEGEKFSIYGPVEAIEFTRTNTGNVSSLTYINTSKNPYLKRFALSKSASVHTIDFSNNRALEQIKIKVDYIELTNLKLPTDASNLKELCVSHSALSSADLTTAPNLQSIRLSGVRLSHIKLPELANCEQIDFSWCTLRASQINYIFNSLPNAGGKKRTIDVRYNPGSDEADYSIAQKKGWTVVTEDQQ